MSPTNPETGGLCVACMYPPMLSETFIRAHIERLAPATVLTHLPKPTVNGVPVLSPARQTWHEGIRQLTRSGMEREWHAAYRKALTRHRPSAVMAEYADTALLLMDVCRELNVPLIVHFHGRDASHKEVIEAQRAKCQRLFAQAAAIVAVSGEMKRRLAGLGAPAEKVFVNPCGVDCEAFSGGAPEHAPALFVAVGRFVDKKCPLLTLRSFEKTYEREPSIRLQMIGDGPLLQACRDYAAASPARGAISLPGPQPPSAVALAMKGARAFVQHSVTPLSGDSEGTPVSILEACATGLPVVATRHAGIPEVIRDGHTGFLVDERDVDGMADHMLALARQPAMAGALGRAAQAFVRNNHRIEESARRLQSIVGAVARGIPMKSDNRAPETVTGVRNTHESPVWQ